MESNVNPNHKNTRTSANGRRRRDQVIVVVARRAISLIGTRPDSGTGRPGADGRWRWIDCARTHPSTPLNT